MLTRVKVYCPLHGNRICITNRDPYPTTEAGAAPFRFCSFLKVDRATSGRLQGRFPECLGQRWLQGEASINQLRGEGEKKLTCACVVRAMSSELAPYSSARTPSAIISPAFGPAIKEYKNEPESTATQGRSI